MSKYKIVMSYERDLKFINDEILKYENKEMTRKERQNYNSLIITKGIIKNELVKIND